MMLSLQTSIPLTTCGLCLINPSAPASMWKWLKP